MAAPRRYFIAPLIACALACAPQAAAAAEDPNPTTAPLQSPAPDAAPKRVMPGGTAVEEDRSPSPSGSSADASPRPDAPHSDPLEIVGSDERDKPPTAQQQRQSLADGIAKEKAQEAARQAVSEARAKYEQALAKHRLNKAKIFLLKKDSDRAERKAARARRDMGNMARLAYSAGDTDLNLVAALLDSRSPQEVLSGAGTAARIASHKETEWNAAITLQAEADELAAEAKELAATSAAKLTAAKEALADAMDVAESVDLAIEPPKRVPPVDLTTKSDWVFPTGEGSISSEAGMRMHPILGYTRCHAGADITAPSGTPIYAVDDGVVLTAGVNGGYGNYTLVAHGKGMTSAYAHQQLILVKAGQRVTRGQLIGEVGSTGLSTGAHLHFEAAYHGVPHDPRGWLEDRPERRIPAC